VEKGGTGEEEPTGRTNRGCHPVERSPPITPKNASHSRAESRKRNDGRFLKAYDWSRPGALLGAPAEGSDREKRRKSKGGGAGHFPEGGSPFGGEGEVLHLLSGKRTVLQFVGVYFSKEEGHQKDLDLKGECTRKEKKNGFEQEGGLSETFLGARLLPGRKGDSWLGVSACPPRSYFTANT